jgi:hypothetical protein
MTLLTDEMRARLTHLDAVEERQRGYRRAYQRRRLLKLRAARPPDTPEQQAALARLKERWND